MPSGKKRWLNSLALKILLAFVAGALLSIALLVLSGRVVKERLPGMDLSDYTHRLAQDLQFDARGQPTGFNNGDQFPLWIYQSITDDVAYRVLDGEGRVVLMSPGAQHWPTVAPQVSREFKFTLNGMIYDGATEPYVLAGKTWWIQMAASSRIIDFLHRGFALPFIRFGIELFSLVLLVVFGLCAWVTLKYSLKPLRNVSTEAALISPRSLDARLQTRGVPTEISPLIDSFNQALARLEKGYRNQQDFLAKAAHELKTPLTLIRAEVEMMEATEEAREPLLLQVEHLARQVQQLLLLAEASEPLSYQFAQVDVHAIARDCVQFLQRIASDAQVSLTLSTADDPLRWRADRGALFTLLKNLIENAIQHAPPGTSVHIAVSENGFTVRDVGPGVAEDELPLLFSRFWRGAHRRDSGAGLGLAICHEIALAHGWTLQAENALPGLLLAGSTG